MNKPKREFDYGEFTKSHKYFRDKDFPKIVGHAVFLIAGNIESATRKTTRLDFELNGDFIPKNIRAFPRTTGQVSKIESDVRRSHQFIASVAGSDKIAFMSMHDVGGTRKNENPSKYLPNEFRGQSVDKDVLALPSGSMHYSRSYRTSTGKVKEMYKPKNLLEVANKNKGSKQKGRKLAFLIRAKNGHLMIAKRRGKNRAPLEILWHFIPQARIENDWNFTEVGYATLSKTYQKSFADTYKRINASSMLTKYKGMGR